MLLAVASTASASVASIQNSVVTYTGDEAADTVSIRRQTFTQNNQTRIFYVINDNAGLTVSSGCGLFNGEAWCEVGSALRTYDVDARDGDDQVTMTADTAGGTADLGPGNDRFNGRTIGDTADVVNGGAGFDVIKGGTGDDQLDGGDDADQVAGEAGDDRVSGGAGDDQLEFGGDQMTAGADAGADDIRGGAGNDRVSYLDHSGAVRVILDGSPGDGGAGEGDNVHGDVETVVGTTFNDVLVGSDADQDLFGNGGIDRVDGLGGDDILNGGTGDDEIYGGAGADRLEGSADEDYLDGGSGNDFFEGDNVCTTTPCTGASDFIQARDGEADTVNCGVGADTALVDAIDTVAKDDQFGCERVDVALGPVAPTPGGGVLGIAPPTPGVATLKVVGKRRLSSLKRRKLKIVVTCPGSCRLKARLIAGRTVTASQSRTRLGGGSLTLRPKMTKKGRRLIRRRTKIGMTLVVDVRDDQGQTATLTRALRFRK
jgi:Ca2+-binding RTX toxin-like protein